MSGPSFGGLPCLLRLRGEDVGNEGSFLLSAGSHHVGRALNNRLTLPNGGVSRRHAVVQVSPEHVVVEDSGSRNGTFVNGVQVERSTLAPGDRVAFGPVELRVEGLHPEDAQLAVEISRPTPGAKHHGTDRLTSTDFIKVNATAVSWLRLIGHFFGALHSRGGAALALAEMVRELKVSGACFVDLSEPRNPILQAAYGDLDSACLKTLLPRLAQRAAGRPAARHTPTFISRSEATALVPADVPVAIAVIGDFAGRQVSDPLLATLLEIYQGLRPRPATESSVEPIGKACADLCFPAGWVRGVSAPMTALYDQMRPLVDGDLPVLVVGETGVGKELIAQALHLSSPRRDGPFVAINCAAIPADLLEAELFGIGERVATGVAGRKGFFEQAAGGTLFLDEIGEMPVALQTKLLRVLQEKTLRPVGGTPIPIEVRVLAATNADVEAMVDRGTFRRDLFYRITGFVLRIPPLRERREDVPLLVENLLRRFSEESGKPVRGVSVRALRALVEYPWPGNVRELEHVVRRLVYLCPRGQAVELAMLPESIAAAAASPAAAGSHPAAAGEGESAGAESLDLAKIERRTIREALRRCDGNKVRAARLLGISRSALRRRIERLGL